MEGGATDKQSADGRLVFVSYSRQDRDWLRRFQVMLEPLVAEGQMALWADEQLDPGGHWYDEIDGAIRRSSIALLLVSPDFLASAFIRDQEIPALIERGVRLVPVLIRDCLWERVPILMDLQWAHDPRQDGPLAAADPKEWDGHIVRACRQLVQLVDRSPRTESPIDAPHLTEVITRPPAVSLPDGQSLGGHLSAVPALPRGYLVRPEIEDLIEALLSADSGLVGIVGDALSFGLYGQGGVGKTVLAAGIARDSRIRAAFSDGIFWVTAGEHVNLISAQLDLLGRLGVSSPTVHSPTEGLALMSKTISDRRVLIVVDDVWSDATAEAFRITGPYVRVLYTSRDLQTIRAVGASVRVVGQLPDTAALELMADLSGTPREELPPCVERILEATGRVALALALVAATVRSGVTWDAAMSELDDANTTFLRHPYADTFKALGLAISALGAETKDAYFSLAIYPRDTRIPVATISRYWQTVRQWSPEQSRIELEALAVRNLLAVNNDTVSFHDLQHQYALLHVQSLAIRHSELLDAYRELIHGRDWSSLLADDPYIGDHLIRHLIGAGQRAELVATVMDPAYLVVRTSRFGLHATESDLSAAMSAVPGEERIGWLKRWLAQNGHLFAGFASPSDLAPTFLSRLASVSSPVQLGNLRRLLPPHSLSVHWGLPSTLPAMIRTLTGHGGQVNAVAFSPDGKLLASAGSDDVVRLWDPASGVEQQRLAVPGVRVNAVAFSPDGRLLASAGSDDVVRLWDPASAVEEQRLTGHSRAVRALAFSPDGRLLASASDDETVRLWDSRTGRNRRSLTGHNHWASAVAFSPDGQLLASASYDQTVRLWDPASGAEIAVLTGHGGWVHAVAFSPDGRLLASASGDGVRLWNPRTGLKRRSTRGAGLRSYTVAFSPDGQLLASGGDDETVRFGNPVTGSEKLVLTGHRGWVHSMAFSPDGRILATAGHDDDTIRLWDPTRAFPKQKPAGHREHVSAVAFSPDGRRLASASADRTVRLWEPSTGIEQQVFKGHLKWVKAVAFSPDGRFLASASFDETVRLWDLASGIPQQKLTSRPNRVNAVAFSPDGQLLAAASWDDHTVRLWDPHAAVEKFVLTGHRGSVNAVVFSPDGRVVASGGADETVRLWDPDTAVERFVLTGHRGSVNAVVFSPDGRFVASGGSDQRVKVWDALTGRYETSLRLDHDISSLAWNGDRIASAAGNRIVLLMTVGGASTSPRPQEEST